MIHPVSFECTSQTTRPHAKFLFTAVALSEVPFQGIQGQKLELATPTAKGPLLSPSRRTGGMTFTYDAPPPQQQHPQDSQPVMVRSGVWLVLEFWRTTLHYGHLAVAQYFHVNDFLMNLSDSFSVACFCNKLSQL